KLNEIRKVADQITVLRDGMTVKTLYCHADEISEDIIIRNMVGRDLEDRYPPRSVPIGETILEVKNWNSNHQQHRDRQVLHNINVTFRKGEFGAPC
ncbi:ABC transporter ATP-binding protein, partial [Rhizobium ruizarguesonis]